MHLIAKAITISHTKFHYNCTRYSRLRESHFLGHSVLIVTMLELYTKVQVF